MRIQSLLGTGAKPEYQQDELTFEVKVTRNSGEVLSYYFSQSKDASYYVLKRSDLNYYFKLAEYTGNLLKEITREKLVNARTEKAASKPFEDKGDEKDDTEANTDNELEASNRGEPEEDA